MLRAVKTHARVIKFIKVVVSIVKMSVSVMQMELDRVRLYSGQRANLDANVKRTKKINRVPVATQELDFTDFHATARKQSVETKKAENSVLASSKIVVSARILICVNVLKTRKLKVSRLTFSTF